MENTRVFSSQSQTGLQKQMTGPIQLLHFLFSYSFFFFFSSPHLRTNEKKKHILVTEYWNGWYRLSFREVWACLVS